MFRAQRHFGRRAGSGFTLLELIMVIVILGVAAAMLVPQLNAGAERVRLVTAARSVVQASRYARAMALQHQAETEVSFDPATGTVEVRAHTLGAKADILLSLAEARDAEEETATEHAFSEEDADQESGVQTNLTAEVATAQSFADEISAKFENKDITFEFLGYTDNVDNDAKAPPAKTEGDNPPFSLIFRSNGTCRPFKVRALTEEGDYLDVTVDVIGKAKIEEYGDDD